MPPSLIAIRAPVVLPPEVQRLLPDVRVALLFGGHSLQADWSETLADEYNEVVAVNGAAYFTSCDYAVMVDRKVVEGLLQEKKRHPRRALVTYPCYERNCRKAGVPWQQIPTLGPKLKSYTAPRAVMVALKLAGLNGNVDVYGMDFGNEQLDVGGLTGCHDGNRWKEEAECFRAVWDGRCRKVGGRINAKRLAFIAKEIPNWPG